MAWTYPVLGITVGLLVGWAALLWMLWRARPDRTTLREALHLVPDLVRLLRRLAADPRTPTAARVRLVLLLAYLLCPVDLVPDVVPVIGYADDAIVVVLALRSVVRLAGPDALERHWTGTPDGLAAVRRFAGLAGPDAAARPGTDVAPPRDPWTRGRSARPPRLDSEPVPPRGPAGRPRAREAGHDDDGDR